jgi:hypothetical protein
MSKDAYLKKLEPRSIQATLMRAGLLLTGWELLENEIVVKVRDFFWTDFDKSGHKYDERYEREVLTRSKHRFEASLLWLVEMSALTSVQADSIRAMREHRNKVAHQLPTLLVDPGEEISPHPLEQMREALKRLAVFWGRIEVDANPDYDNREIDHEEIESGSSLLMNYLIEVCDQVSAETVQ